MITVPLTPGLFDYAFTVDIDEVMYNFRMVYNSRSRIYYLDIRDIDRNPILMGYPLVEGANTGRFSIPGLFGGLLLVFDTSRKQENGDKETMGQTVKVYHIPEDEL